MLRLTEIKLPLESTTELAHPPEMIKGAILKKLGIDAQDLLSFEIFKRGVDARKSHAILFVYSLDIEVKNQDKLLAKFKKDPHVNLAPDTSYHFVAQAPKEREGGWGDARPLQDIGRYVEFHFTQQAQNTVRC